MDALSYVDLLSILGLLPYETGVGGGSSSGTLTPPNMTGPTNPNEPDAGDSGHGASGVSSNVGQGKSGPGTASPADRSALGWGGRAMSAANLGLSLAGAAVPGLGMAPMGINAMLGLDKALSALGVPQAKENAYAGYMDPGELQGIKDTYGDFAYADAVAQNAAIAQRAAEIAPDMEANYDWGSGGFPGGPSAFGGPGTMANSVAANSYGGLGPGGSVDTSGSGGFGMGGPGSNAGGGNGPGGGGPGGGGDGGGYGDGGEQRGGVLRSRPGHPRKVLFGEGTASPRGETAIFIPEFMKAPGMQGKEREVLRALQHFLGVLRPAGGRA